VGSIRSFVFEVGLFFFGRLRTDPHNPSNPLRRTVGPTAQYTLCAPPSKAQRSSRVPRDASQHTNPALIKVPFHFLPRFLSESYPMSATLRNQPSLNLDKTRFSAPFPLPKPMLKIQ
jgi:hypothetical protein